MKKILIALVVWGCCQLLGASGPIVYKFLKTNLFIYSGAPPALVYVSDSQGRRTGADPALPISNDGMQGRSPVGGLMEIPNSLALQDSIENSTTTSWEVKIADSGAQTYTVNIQGMVTGNEQISVGAFLLNNPKQSRNTFKNINVLVNPGQLRKVILTFNPDQGAISLQRVVLGGDLLSDVKAACQLKLITSKACKSLTRKAKNVQIAFQNNNSQEEKLAIDGFLSDLNRLKSSIKEPTFSALQADANALLQTVNQ